MKRFLLPMSLMLLAVIGFAVLNGKITLPPLVLLLFLLLLLAVAVLTVISGIRARKKPQQPVSPTTAFVGYGLVFLLFLAAGILVSPVFFWLTGLFLLAIAVFVVLFLGKQKSMLALMRPLMHDCDPYPVIEALEKKTALEKNPAQKSVCQLLLWNARWAAGQKEAAEELLFSTDPGPLIPQGAPYADYLRCMACTFLKKDPDRAEKYLDQALAVTEKAEKYVKNTGAEVDRFYRAELALNRGKTDEAETLLQAGFPSMQAPIHQVNLHALFGRLYDAQGKTAKAIEAMRYCAEHGNRLAVAETAKAYLAEKE